MGLNQNYIITFGKHKNKDLLYVMENDPKYLIWLDGLENLDEHLRYSLKFIIDSKYFSDCLEEYNESEYRFVDANMKW